MNVPNEKRFFHLLDHAINFRLYILPLIVLNLSSCVKHESITYRYRMIVNYQTAQGAMSASAVREMTFQKQPAGPFGNTDVHISVRGQAIIMPVAHKRLYAILKWQPDKVLGLPDPGDFAHEIVTKVLIGPKSGNILSYEKVKNSLDSSSRPYRIFLDRRYWPVFVRFEDEKEPKTVSICKAEDVNGNCGVKVTDIIIEKSKSTVSFEIKNFLPWVDASDNKTLSGDKGIFNSKVDNLLDYNSFLMEH